MTMDSAEAARVRGEILGDVGELLREHLAADAWGRALVEVVRGADGEPIVAGVDVEDIVGDEDAIDAAFAPERAGPLLPVLAKAIEALCSLEDVRLEDVRGGTFLRLAARGFAWLPGLVHAPSEALDRAWYDVTARLGERRRTLASRFGLSGNERIEVDLEGEHLTFFSGTRPHQRIARARATLLGTLSRAARCWAWGGSNEALSPAIRRSSAAVVDGVLERDLWELSTPVFSLDEATAWTLCAFVCDRAGGEGVHSYENHGALVFVLLRDVRNA